MAFAAAGAVAYRSHANLEAVVVAPPSPSPVTAIPAAAEPEPQPVAPADRARAMERKREFDEAMAQAAAKAAPVAHEETPAPSASLASPEPSPPPATTSAPSTNDVHVVVYTASWCSVCKRAKVWMAAHGIAYEERDIDASSDNARRIRVINPRASIPTFDVEGEVLVGFDGASLVATMQHAAARQAAARAM